MFGLQAVTPFFFSRTVDRAHPKDEFWELQEGANVA